MTDIRMGDKTQALVLAHHGLAAPLEQILRGNGSAYLAGVAVYHWEAYEGFGRHQLRRATASAIGVKGVHALR